MNKLILIIIFSIIYFTQVPNAFSQENIKQNKKVPAEIQFNIPENQEIPLTLEDSINIALKNNFDIKIIATQQDRDKWLYYNNLSEFLPDVNFQYEQSKFTGTRIVGGGIAIRGSDRQIITGFVSEWQGFTGLLRYFNSQAARYNYKATKKRLDLTQDQVLSLVSRQYYILLQNKISIQIREKALEQTQAQLKLNQQRFEAGVGTRFDVITSEAQVASARQDLIEATNRYRLSQAQLANTLGIDVIALLVPADKNIEPITLIKGYFDLNKIIEVALKNKPDIDIEKLNIAATRAKRNSGYSVYLPQAGIQVSNFEVGRNVSDLVPSNSLAFVVNWQGGNNLGLGGFTNIKALNAQVRESKLKLITTTRDIEQSIINSYYNNIAAKELIDVSQEKVVSAEESLRLATIRLEAGVGTYIDVINAQVTEPTARINYLNAIIAYNISQAQLLYDMGVISPSNLLQGYTFKNNAKPKK